MKNFQYYLERVNSVNETYTGDYPYAEDALERIKESVPQKTGKDLMNWSNYSEDLEWISKHPKSSSKFIKFYSLKPKQNLNPENIFATIFNVANSYERN
jgi:hypothetical protein